MRKLDGKHTKKQAKTLSKEDIRAILSLPNTEENLLLKVWLVISICFAARGCECNDVEWTCINRVPPTTQTTAMYKVQYRRAKDDEAKDAEPDHSFVTGASEVKALDDYSDCFEQHIGRFFRKLRFNKRSRKCEATLQVIGHNTSSKYYKRMAQILGKCDWEMYTGHSARRTSITLMANAGLIFF